MKPVESGATAGPVLLIEDDADTRESMRALLVGAGHRVIAADEGRKAIELAAAVQPALVVLDLVTRGMSGWEFLDRRVDEPALSGVPVIVVTGASEMPPGISAVLRKPFEPRALLEAVRRLLRRAADA